MTLETIKLWHKDLIRGLKAPDPKYIGRFRGERGLEHVEVRIGKAFGVRSDLVGAEVKLFQEKLHAQMDFLDTLIDPTQGPDSVGSLSAVLDLCAWAHAEWVRIHPFANGNGRTARILADCLALRYGLPPFVRVRPRPGYGYGEAGAAAMKGNWRPTVAVFRHMLKEFRGPRP